MARVAEGAGKIRRAETKRFKKNGAGAIQSLPTPLRYEN